MSSLPDFISRADLGRAIEVVKQCRYHAPLNEALCDALSVVEAELHRRLRERQDEVEHEHRPVQHRDGKPPWCAICRLTAAGEIPGSSIGR